MNILIKNIKGLVQVRENQNSRIAGEEMAELPVLNGAFLYIKDGLIEDYGEMGSLPESYKAGAQITDAGGKYVFPSFVDSHTHLVYAASRDGEFTDRIKGLTYEEIAKRGGGILNSAAKLQKMSEEELFVSALDRLYEIIDFGTGAVEIKSGYGLTLKDELKMLRVIQKLKKVSPITIKATFLGAHAFPKDVSRDDYMNSILHEMLPQVAEENLADYCDVFCDRGFFTPEETDRILLKAADFGLKAKIHANELGFTGGVQAGVARRALSVDHLECVGDEEIALLKGSDTMPTLLPGTAFFLGMEYPPARKMIESGLPVALASDYNPGSSPSGNMPFVLSLACIRMKMLPSEAINAATVNSAYAMDLSETHGRIAKGRPANLFITKAMSSLDFLPYAFGSNLVETVILNGKDIED